MSDLSFLDLGEYCELQDTYISSAGLKFVNTQIRLIRSSIYDRLRLRYNVQAMKTAEPDTVKRWIADIIAPKIYAKRGVDPTDMVYSALKEAAKTADEQITSAADSSNGMYQLPLLNSELSAASKPQVLTKSDADPGRWKRTQATRARYERDRDRGNGY